MVFFSKFGCAYPPLVPFLLYADVESRWFGFSNVW